MKNESIATAIATMWISTGVAVMVAVSISRSITPLWFMLIPLIGGAYMKRKDDGNDRN